MVLQIAWRNIWRSRTRSLVVIGAVLLGVWSFISLMAFTSSMVKSYVKNAIRFQTSHLQIHNPDFIEDKELEFTISDKANLISVLNKEDDIDKYTERTLVNGMIRSARGARGVVIRGVQPEKENALSNISEEITDGKYFSPKKSNEILISEELAKKLQIKVRKKIVLQFQDFNKEINQGSFRVVGIYKTGNTMFDLGMVIVDQKDINTLVGNAEAAHEYAIMLKNPETLDQTKVALAAALPHTKIETYRELSPDIKLYESQIGISSAIFLTIFMLALIFGIINTMLMAVLERNKEIGMLMAVGMNKLKVFGMIVWETLMLGLIGAPLGLLAGVLTVRYFAKDGINLGNFAEGIERFGLATIIKPELDAEIYIQLMVAVFITALLASIYPAIKAIRLKPIEAMHKI